MPRSYYLAPATMSPIQMLDLVGLHQRLEPRLSEAMQRVVNEGAFIRGADVGAFECELAAYLEARFTLGVGNGTDALQIALMALDLKPGDEVITSPFTFIATAEAAALLGLVPVFCDIDPKTFNVDPEAVAAAITPRTRAIVPVHLFGQPADMAPILELAARHDLFVIEDNAQGIGSTYRDQRTTALGHVGTLSFFPSKNLGAMGDGGAVVTQDETLFERLRMIANHGARRKYYHEIVGVNSRLDTLQAAILRVKLAALDDCIARRQAAARRYDAWLSDVPGIITPYVDRNGTHVYHQYTIRVTKDFGRTRDALADHLKANGIPCMVYYPVALHQLPVFHHAAGTSLPHAEQAAAEVLSLPMHTELTAAAQEQIVSVLTA